MSNKHMIPVRSHKRKKPRPRRDKRTPRAPRRTSRRIFKQTAPNGMMTVGQPGSGLLGNLFMGAAFSLVSQMVESGRRVPTMERSSYDNTRAEISRAQSEASSIPVGSSPSPVDIRDFFRPRDAASTSATTVVGGEPPRTSAASEITEALDELRGSLRTAVEEGRLSGRSRSPSVASGVTDFSVYDELERPPLLSRESSEEERAQIMLNTPRLLRRMQSAAEEEEGAGAEPEPAAAAAPKKSVAMNVVGGDPTALYKNEDYRKMSRESLESILRHRGLLETYKAKGGLGQQSKGRMAFIEDNKGARGALF